MSDVVQHVVSMLGFARGAQRSPGGVAVTLRREPGAPRRSYIVTVREGQRSGEVSFPLALGEHGWEVKGYGALAERLLAHWKLAKAPASASSPADTLQALLAAAGPALRDLGDRLSARWNGGCWMRWPRSRRRS